MTNAPAPHNWRPLSRADLTTFDDVMTNIVMEYMDLGWTGRMTKRGHASLRAPDGESTTSVSRSSGRGGSGTRARADLERWKANRPGRAFGIGIDQPTEIRTFESKTELDNFRMVKTDPRVIAHIRMLGEQGHTTDSAVERLMVNISTETPGDWYAIDTVLHKVIAWGGTLTEADAYSTHYGKPKENPMTITAEPEVTTGGLYQCTYPGCGESFDEWRSLGGHANGHLPLVQCPHCSWEGKYVGAHLRKKHGDILSAFDAAVEEAFEEVVDGETIDVGPVIVEPAPEVVRAAAVSATIPVADSSDPADCLRLVLDELTSLRKGAADVALLRTEVSVLTAERDEARKERDDLSAKLALLRDALNL